MNVTPHRGIATPATLSAALLAFALPGVARAQVGACCIEGGGVRWCDDLSAADCFVLRGTYHGDGSSCETTICFPAPPPPAEGACCISIRGLDGEPGFVFCAILTETDCTLNQGSYLGDGTSCPGDTFPEPDPPPPNPCLPGVYIFPGDMNMDGQVNVFDIDIFVEALVNPEGFEDVYPSSRRLLADITRDGNVDFFDLEPFVGLLV